LGCARQLLAALWLRVIDGHLLLSHFLMTINDGEAQMTAQPNDHQ